MCRTSQHLIPNTPANRGNLQLSPLARTRNLTVAPTQIKITEAEYHARRVASQQQIALINCDGLVLFDSFYILYYTGFAFIPTERPIAFLMNTAGQMAMCVLGMETEHAGS